MELQGRSAQRLKSEINVTPMIDVLMVLLIIFMVISPVRSAGLKSEIPRSDSEPVQSRTRPDEAIVVSINYDQVIQVNQQPIATHLLRVRLQAVLKSKTDRSVLVWADSELPFEVVAATIDRARGAGADRIGLLTERLQAAAYPKS